MRMPRTHKDKRLDILSFTSTFPEDYLPYTSSYHREAPYLVWEDRETRNRKKCDRRKWKCSDSRVPCRRCSKSSLLLACTITLGIILLTAVIAASVYLGWLTHLRNSSIVSLTGRLRVVEGDEFTPRLADTDSEEFREKAKKYETLLETVYEESALRNALVKARILEFKEGSLEVNFYLTLEEPSGQRATNLSFEAKEILRREIENEDSPVFGPELKMTLERLVVLDEEEGIKYEMVQKSPEPDETEAVEKPRWPIVTSPTILESNGPSSTTSTSAPPNLETHRISEEIPVHSGPWRPLMEMDRGGRDKIIPNLFTTSSPKTSLPLLYNDPQIRRGLRNQRNRTFVADRTNSFPKSEVKEVELESPSLVLKSQPDAGDLKQNKTSSEIRFVSGFSVVRSGNYNAPGSTTKVTSSTTEAPRVDLAEDRSNVDTEDKTEEEEPEIVEKPLLIRDSHSPPSKVNSSLKLPQPSVRHFRPGAGFAVQTAGQSETIEIPVEASLNLKRPAKGQGFVVAVEEAIVPETISLPASTTEKPEASTSEKPDVSTELTVGASLFIRNSRTQLDKPARPNLPFGVRKPTTKSNYFSPSPTPTKKLNSSIENSSSSDGKLDFPELKINVPFNVRGSSKGQAYVTLPKPKNESTAIVADINATSAEVKLKKPEVDSTREDESSPGGVPKIISQYNPYNKDPSSEEDGLSLRDKYDILSISKPFFHLRTENITKYPTLKPDFTTTITLEEMPFTGTTNGLGFETTKEDYTLAPTTEPIGSLEIASSQGHPEDLGLQSIAVSPPKKCKEEEFACVSAKSCIPKTKMCNRQRDCPDASDEMNCSCADYLKSRIFRSKICDGTIDCWDYSDENNCPWCSPEKFICPGAKLCVNQSKVCDGNPDCPGSEDEAHCVKLISDHGDAERVEYRREGHLVLRKNGQWRKLCVSNFPISSSDADEDSWTVQELGKAVCNALSFRGLISVKSDFNSLQTFKSEFFKFRSSKSLPGLSIHSLEKSEECPDRNLLKVSCNSLECGLRPISLGFRRRIVGGQSSLFGSWPWQVALYKEGEFQCGAVIIKDRWIISAGHCFYHSKESHWTARMGLLRRGSEIPSPYEQIANVTLIRMHPDYVDRGFINDIVLLKLEKPVLFSDQVRPICLPQITEDTRAWQGQTCTAIGWGKLFEVGRIFPDTLQEVQLPIISTEECRKRTSFLPLYKITDNMFCAGYERGGRDACLGDSGGPLMCQRANGRWSLVGVTSNGDGCGRPGRPGVYTKVVNYLEWIYSVIEKEDSETAGRTSVCDGHRCPLGKCLPKKKVCDKVMDCWDGSDEKRC